MDFEEISESSVKGLSRREKEKQRHCAEVLFVAEELFAERGFHSVTMQQIADKAEFAVGTIYQMFDGKETLYAAILDNKADLFLARTKEVLRSKGSPISSLGMIVETYVSFFLQERAFFKIFVNETRGFAWSIRASMNESIQHKYRDFVTMLKRLFSKAIDNGQLRPYDSEDLVIAFCGIIHSFLTHWTAEEIEIDVEKGTEKIKRIFLDPISLRATDQEGK